MIRRESIRRPNPGVLALFCVLLFTLFSFTITAHADGFPIIAVLHAGNHPEGIAVDTQTHMVYIGYEYPGLLVAFDPIAGTVRWHTPLGGTVTDVQVDSTHHHVFAVSSSFQSKPGTLVILDEATGKILLSAPVGFGDNGLTVDTKRQRIYVSDDQSSTINVFTLEASPTGELRTEPSTLLIGTHPQALGVNSRLGRLYAGDAADNKVIVYDEDKGRIVAMIPVAAGPVQPLRVDEATGRVYVVCSQGQELDVIDGNTNIVIAHVPVSPYPEGVAFNTATGRIYVADEGNDGRSSGTTITVIDGQSFNVLGTLQVGRAPDGVEADPQLRRVYVATEESNALVEVSDSVDLPLTSNTTLYQAASAQQTISLLQQATRITLILMILTILGAMMGVLLQRWRVQGIPRILLGSVSFRSEKHTPPL